MVTREKGSREGGRRSYMRNAGKLLLRKLLLLISSQGNVVIYNGGVVGPGSLVRREGPKIILRCKQARVKRATTGRRGSQYRQLRMLLVKIAFLVDVKVLRKVRGALDVQSRKGSIVIFIR